MYESTDRERKTELYEALLFCITAVQKDLHNPLKSALLTDDSITVSSTWELTSVSLRYPQGDGVYTSLSRLVYCTHV